MTPSAADRPRINHRRHVRAIWHGRCCVRAQARPALTQGRSNNRRRGAMSTGTGEAMAMDIWYELRLLEMSDLNAAADELLREADVMSGTPDGADDEEQ